jgi:hypothetical protein
MTAATGPTVKPTPLASPAASSSPTASFYGGFAKSFVAVEPTL